MTPFQVCMAALGVIGLIVFCLGVLAGFRTIQIHFKTLIKQNLPVTTKTAETDPLIRLNETLCKATDILAQIQIWSFGSNELHVKQAKALDSLVLIAKENTDLLTKLDQRMFEYITANRRIMRAMEGQDPNSPTDELFEQARIILEQARDAGIGMTEEDALKRARVSKTYSRG